MEVAQQFDYIMKVMKSSTKEIHLTSSTNMFESFKKRWENKLECPDMLNFIYKFHKEKTKMIANILRK
jgi:hypothetical protein